MSLSLVSSILLGLFCILLIAAAVQDIRTLRISNGLSVGVLLVGLSALIITGSQIWWHHPLSFAVILFVGILLFNWGWMGGGDVKLFAAAAFAFDLQGLLRLIPAVLVIGGLIGLAFIAARILSGSKALSKDRKSLPYGVAIALGAIATVVLFPEYTAFG